VEKTHEEYKATKKRILMGGGENVERRKGLSEVGRKCK
jgi:hypothetical protein